MPEQDFLNRRSGDIEKLFGLAKSDWLVFAFVMSVICNIWLGVEVISTTKDYTKMIVEEVRKQVPQEVDRQVSPMQSKVDTVVRKLNNAIEEKK